jgi:hypothetical protein
MSRIIIAPIVEGHGEQRSAIRTLLTRVWTEIVGGDYARVVRPVRIPRSQLLTSDGLLRAIDLAHLNLIEIGSDDPSLIMVVLDADADPPCHLAPRLLELAQRERGHLDVSVVLANPEFETWFAAAAESLRAFFDLSVAAPSADPESARQQKGAVRQWMGGHYSETIDQPRLTASMDLALCRSRAPSFDKLCRELERRAR